MWSYQIWKYGEAYVVNKHRVELINKSLSAYYSGKYCITITNHICMKYWAAMMQIP